MPPSRARAPARGLRPLLLLCALCAAPLAPLARAEAPAYVAPATDPSTWTGTQYNDHLVFHGLGTLRRLDALIAEAVGAQDPSVLDALRGHCLTTLDLAVAEVRRLPPYKGDSGFRDATLAGYDWMRDVAFGSLWDEIMRGMRQEVVTVSDRDALEARVRRLNTEADAIDGRIKAAQLDFAKRNHMILAEMEEVELQVDRLPSFHHPDFPPSGSALSSAVWVSFPLRYHNQVIGAQNALMEAFNNWIEAMNAGRDLEAPRGAALEVFAAQRALLEGLGDWEGDDSIRAAILACAAEGEALFGAPAEAFVATSDKARKKQTDIDAMNAFIEAGNQLGARLNQAQAPFDAFRDRWGVTALIAFQEAQRGGG